MRYLLSLLIAFSLSLTACHRHEVTNEYKNQKVHPSDREAKNRKKLTKKAEKQARKNMRAAKKAKNKKSRNWGKKGSYQ